MKHAQGIKLAIGCMQMEIKHLSVNANLHDQYHADAPACVEASKRRTELRAAIAALKQPTQVRML